MNRTILITGAAGFVGSHIVEHLLKNTQDNIIGMDSLTYAGTWDRLRDVQISEHPHSHSAYSHPRFTPLVYDFRNEAEPNLLQELAGVTHVLHLGAESHVDNSITDPMRFVQANVVGCANMLDLARRLPNLELFIYFSTDEVLGDVGIDETTGRALTALKEDAPYNSRNPYSATKAGAEQLVVAYANTYNLPAIITRTMNVAGERQHPEKFIPMCISKALYGGHVHIHATPDLKHAGVRSYIHARNVADAILTLINKEPFKKFLPREVEIYHIVGEMEINNQELARIINEYTSIVAEENGIVAEGLTYELVDFHSSRQGHDVAYLLDGSKMRDVVGWEPPKSFKESLFKMISWYIKEGTSWLKK